MAWQRNAPPSHCSTWSASLNCKSRIRQCWNMQLCALARKCTHQMRKEIIWINEWERERTTRKKQTNAERVRWSFHTISPKKTVYAKKRCFFRISAIAGDAHAAAHRVKDFSSKRSIQKCGNYKTDSALEMFACVKATSTDFAIDFNSNFRNHVSSTDFYISERFASEWFRSGQCIAIYFYDSISTTDEPCAAYFRLQSKWIASVVHERPQSAWEKTWAQFWQTKHSGICKVFLRIFLERACPNWHFAFGWAGQHDETAGKKPDIRP